MKNAARNPNHFIALSAINKGYSIFTSEEIVDSVFERTEDAITPVIIAAVFNKTENDDKRLKEMELLFLKRVKTITNFQTLSNLAIGIAAADNRRDSFIVFENALADKIESLEPKPKMDSLLTFLMSDYRKLKK